MTLRLLSVALACSLSAAAIAEDLSTQITVDRTAATELPPAQPLQSVAPVLPPLLTQPVTLQPSYYTSTSAYTPLTGQVEGEAVTGLPAPDLYKGYLWLGYLPVYDRSLGAGYRIIDLEDSHASASLLYTGANWGASEGSRKKGLDVFGIQADGSHRFCDAARVWLDIRYRYTNAGAWDENEFLRDATSQHINDFKLGFGVAGRSGRFDWKLSAAYTHMSVSANRIEAMPGIEAPHDSRFRADLEGGVNIGNGSRFSLGIYSDILNGGGNFTVTPAYHLVWRNIAARVGLKVSAGSSFDYSKVHVAPDIEVAWNPSGRFSAFVKADGGTRFYTLADQYAVTPFLTGALESVNTFTAVNSRLGFTLRPAAAVSVSLFGTYEATDGLPVMTLPAAPAFKALSRVDSRVLGGGLSAAYSWRKTLDVHGEVRFMQHGLEHASASNPYHAAVMAELGLKLRPIEPLAVEAGWKFRAGQRLWLDKDTYSSLPNLSDISLGGSYALSDRFDVFLRFSNLLCRRTMIVPGVMSQRLGGLAGVSVRF
ncbi:MAG: hypothetical protein HDS65_03655 [Bacteroidales bacterium]|nr:hypothetical protein [Bacteroidales bacterium]